MGKGKWCEVEMRRRKWEAQMGKWRLRSESREAKIGKWKLEVR